MIQPNTADLVLDSSTLDVALTYWILIIGYSIDKNMTYVYAHIYVDQLARGFPSSLHK